MAICFSSSVFQRLIAFRFRISLLVVAFQQSPCAFFLWAGFPCVILWAYGLVFTVLFPFVHAFDFGAPPCMLSSAIFMYSSFGSMLVVLDYVVNILSFCVFQIHSMNHPFREGRLASRVPW